MALLVKIFSDKLSFLSMQFCIERKECLSVPLNYTVLINEQLKMHKALAKR